MGLRLSLRLRLFLLTLAALLPAVAVLAYIQINIRESRTLEVRDLALRSATLAASEIERITEGVGAVMRAVGQAPTVRRFDDTDCTAYLRDLLPALPQLAGITVLDVTAQLRCSSTRRAFTDFSDRPYFKEALASPEVVVGEYTVGRATDRRVLPLAFAMRGADGKPLGVIVASIDLEWLGRRLRERRLPEGGSLTVADRNGVIISREPLPERFVGTRIPAEFLKLVTAPEPGTVDVTSQDGTRRVLGYVPASPSLGLYVSAGLSSEASYQAVERATRISAWIAAGGALLALLLAWLVGERTLRQPIRALTLTLERWRQGDATVRTGASPFTGEIGMLGHSLDEMMDEITRRQQDRELLFNELDHRVKNTLATVQAIAISTFNTPERGKAAVPEFSARIVALGKAHDVLTREKWEGAHLREIAMRVMEPVTGRAGERCAIDGPDVFLEPRQALAFTMVLHELCTNAVKYGALSQPSGTVRVSWDLGPESIRPSLALTWKEHDGPPVMTPERTGFGSRLIRQGFARELGDVALDFEPDGVRCVIRTVVEPTGAETMGSESSGS